MLDPVAAAVAPLVAIGLCVGCGTAHRADAAATVVEHFQAALDRGDGAAACGQLNEETASNLVSQEGRPCEQAILDLDLPAGRAVRTSSVHVTSAAVSLTAGGTMFLDEAPRGWEISAAGCKPTEPDRPLDCELDN